MSVSTVRRRLRRRHTATAGPRIRPTAIAFPALVFSAGASFGLARATLTAASSAAWWRPDDAIAVGLTGLGTLIAGWYALTAFALLLSRLAAVDRGIRRWGAPLLRTLSAGAGSLALAVGAPAMAGAAAPPHTPPVEDLAWGEAPDLAWAPSSPDTPVPAGEQPSPSSAHTSALPSPTAPVASSASAALSMPTFAAFLGHAAPSEMDEREEETVVEQDSAAHVVVRGESLWAIARAEDPDAPNARIAGRVAEYVAANPAVQSNPDLIHPGQVLRVPEEAP